MTYLKAAAVLTKLLACYNLMSKLFFRFFIIAINPMITLGAIT